jgi:hypothetical protein
MKAATSVLPGILYDARLMNRMIGSGLTHSRPVPQVPRGHMVMWYGGWNFKTLRESDAGRSHTRLTQRCFDNAKWTAPPGYYRMAFLSLETSRKTWDEQIRSLRESHRFWMPAPTILVASVLVTHLRQTGRNVLGDEIVRCSDGCSDHHIGISIEDHHLAIRGVPDNYRSSSVWMAACMRLS